MIYLCTVYSSGANGDKKVLEERYLKAMDFVAHYKHRHVYSPILHCHPMAMKYDFPKDYDFWRQKDEAFIRAADEVWVLMSYGWKESKGITEEIQYAKSIGKRVKYFADIKDLYPGVTDEF